jgi:hypothetical protein
MGLEESNYHTFGEGQISDGSREYLRDHLEEEIDKMDSLRQAKGFRTATYKLNEDLNNRIIRYEIFYKKTFGVFYYPRPKLNLLGGNNDKTHL